MSTKPSTSCSQTSSLRSWSGGFLYNQRRYADIPRYRLLCFGGGGDHKAVVEIQQSSTIQYLRLPDAATTPFYIFTLEDVGLIGSALFGLVGYCKFKLWYKATVQLPRGSPGTTLREDQRTILDKQNKSMSERLSRDTSDKHKDQALGPDRQFHEANEHLRRFAERKAAFVEGLECERDVFVWDGPFEGLKRERSDSI